MKELRILLPGNILQGLDPESGLPTLSENLGRFHLNNRFLCGGLPWYRTA